MRRTVLNGYKRRDGHIQHIYLNNKFKMLVARVPSKEQAIQQHK